RVAVPLLVLVSCCRADSPTVLPAFPTRRSSDLVDAKLRYEMRLELPNLLRRGTAAVLYVTQDYREAMAIADRIAVLIDGRLAQRSEEHTSELQSRFELVCRLLLEKKKTKDSTVE